jgi:ketosteroid isomerase-like protein
MARHKTVPMLKNDQAAILKDDQHAIAVAKTEYREAYNAGDVQRLLSVFASKFVDCSDGEPSFYGEEARAALQMRSSALFDRHRVELSVIMIDIVVNGDFAYDRGWHKVRLIDKRTGEAKETKYRYFETWNKKSGAWKIDYIITNKEMPPLMLPEWVSASRETRLSGKAVS